MVSLVFDPFTLRETIREHGKPLTFNSKSSVAYNPVTGGVAETSVPATVLGYFYSYRSEDLDGQNVVFGDRKLALPTTDVLGVNILLPKRGDTFVGEGDKVTVVRVDKVMSGQNAVAYICQVRE